MLSSHFLFMRKPTPACPLLASEWYSRWPVWRVVKLSSFLRTSPSPITSHAVLFSFSSSSSSCTCSSFSNVLRLCVAIFSRSPLVWWFFLSQRFLAPLYVVWADPNHLLGHIHPCCWGLEALAYLYFACWFVMAYSSTLVNALCVHVENNPFHSLIYLRPSIIANDSIIDWISVPTFYPRWPMLYVCMSKITRSTPSSTFDRPS